MKEQLTAIKNKVQNMPEFSESNYPIAGYVVGTLITISGAFLIYEVLSTDALTFKANWNMFRSPLGSICIFIGFIWAMLWWGKFTHWSATPVIEYRNSSGRVVGREENMDIMEQGFAKILMPILGHFVIEPIMYGAFIYYPVQCVVALVGAIFPYILTLIVLAIIAGSWLYTREVTIRYRSALLVLCGLIFTVAFAWGGYAIHQSGPGSTIQMLADNSASDEAVEAEETDEEAESQEAADGDAGDEEEFAEGEDESESQFEGVGEEGLYGSLPIGTTKFVGEMADFPIEFTITKTEDMGDITAVYKNVKYGTTMNLTGESLPAQAGDIDFYGKDGDADWLFSLTGDANTGLTGTAQSGDKQMKLTLKKD